MLRSIALFSALSFGVMTAAPALAGFEWVPPAETPAPAASSMTAPAMNAPGIPAGPTAQDMMGFPPQGWDMVQTPPDPYAQQQQAFMQPQPMMMPQQMAPAPQAYYPPQQAGYYAGAQAFANPVPPAPVPAPAGGLMINPYPMVQAGYAPSMMNTGSMEGAMMAESRTLNPLQLGNGLSTGGKARQIAPSMPAPVPVAPPQPSFGAYPAPMPSSAHGLSPMPGAALAPLPGATQAAYAPYAPPPVMQAPVAPPPAPVAAAPLSPPPVMDQTRADTSYPKGAPTSALRAPSAPPAAMATPVSLPPSGGKYEDAVGFGKDLPLALALSQIIPGDFALFFETAIDAETNVSWQGGKPWDQVLQEMLAPLGLRAVIQPNLVMIRSA